MQMATVNVYPCNTCQSRQHAHFEVSYLGVGKHKYKLLVCNGCGNPLMILGEIEEHKFTHA